MTPALLSLIMDFVVLLALAGTIYFVMRLSRALENFKTHRDEMRKMVLELSVSIDQAQEAVKNLKASGNAAADDLEDVLYDSRRMAEELKLINDTSNSLASRLESLAQSSRRAVPDGQTEETSQYEDPPVAAPQKEQKNYDDVPSFFIKDTDFEGDQDNQDHGSSELKSRAEQELYDALQKNKTKSGGA